VTNLRLDDAAILHANGANQIHTFREEAVGMIGADVVRQAVRALLQQSALDIDQDRGLRRASVTEEVIGGGTAAIEALPRDLDVARHRLDESQPGGLEVVL